jgi:molybdopterin-guanine dinucleotide biosynthesis protein A
MGRDKAALPWGGGVLLDHMVALLSTTVEHVRVVGRDELPDRVPGHGPLGGILTALDVTDTEENLIVAVDLPLLTPEFLRAFYDRFLMSPRPLLACQVEDRFPLCLGVRRALRPEIQRRMEGRRLSIQDLIASVQSELLGESFLTKLNVDASIFANVNSPEDWARLQKLNP